MSRLRPLEIGFWVVRFFSLGMILLVCPVGGAAQSEEAVSPLPQVIHIRVESAIHPVVADYIVESIAAAEEQEAQALLIELNTPGGLLTSTRTITGAILRSTVPVVVFVAPGGAQAASAGFFILTSADVAAMAPGTNTGAAHPVAGQGQDIEGEMGRKVEEDTAALIRSLAQERGRDIDLAESTVRESRSFTAEEALAEGLVDFLAVDAQALLEKIDGFVLGTEEESGPTLATQGVVLVERPMPAAQKFLSVLAHPNVAGILMFLGLLGLYMELSNPGVLLPGVVGAICLLLGFFAMSVLPINYAGIGLILLALVFFIAETQVPTFGLLTLGGIVSLVIGSVMVFKDTEQAFGGAIELVVGFATGTGLIIGFLSFKAISMRRGKVTTGREGLLSEHGVARTDLAPKGKVFIHGELWNAVATGDPVDQGEAVEVVAVQGLTLEVRALERSI